MNSDYIVDRAMLHDVPVTVHIPIKKILQRHVIFPDFGSSIEGEPLPSEITVEQYNTKENHSLCDSIMEDFRDYYPDRLEEIGEDRLMAALLRDNLTSWQKQKDLDLRGYF